MVSVTKERQEEEKQRSFMNEQREMGRAACHCCNQPPVLQGELRRCWRNWALKKIHLGPKSICFIRSHGALPKDKSALNRSISGRIIILEKMLK